jgi:ATPase family associated with various cellular activities (AAA)
MLTFPTAAVADEELSTCYFARAGLARLAASCTTLDPEASDRIQAASWNQRNGAGLLQAFREYLKRPGETDRALLTVARHFRLTLIETLAVRLAVLAEGDLLISHVLTHLQQPLAQGRPTLGLLAQAFAAEEPSSAIHVLGQGAAVRCGLLQLSGDDLPLPERQVRVPLPTSLALQDMKGAWPATSLISSGQYHLSLGQTAERHAAELGERLSSDRLTRGTIPAPAVLIRGGDALENRSAARLVCSKCETEAVLIHTEDTAGIAPWLVLNQVIPVFTQSLAPGERRGLPVIRSFDGPIIVLTSGDGDFETDGRPILDWRLGIPSSAERVALWSSALHDTALAQRMGNIHRHTAGRIAALAAKVCDRSHHENITYEGICAVARRGESVGLGALAELIPDEVSDDALVLTSKLRQELDSLVVRCRLREQFADALGPSIRARYRPSVRVLLAGPSGTGKTLAVAWLATRLGMPLYRVDLSAITSKYIGETEKNLSQLFTRAEQNEVVLLFDEADSLFGKRTEIHEANDRFANAQTNYLLQRMESYDGITVLTSNGRGHFDAAFSRRFDAIVEFPFPGAEERRALWAAHLGGAHGVESMHLDLLATVAELSGGQIRNAVLRSAVAAAQEGTAILYRHLLIGVGGEYSKLNRQLPNELKQANVPDRK